MFGIMGLLLPCSSALAQTDTTHVVEADSVIYGGVYLAKGWKWVSKHMGADVFLTGEYFGLHLDGPTGAASDGGVGIEVRVHPFSLGYIIGFCGKEGIPGVRKLDEQQGGIWDFTYRTIYVGVTVGKYRLEAGETNADNSWSVSNSPSSSYTSAFLGMSRRVGGMLFFEPELKIMYPVVSHYWNTASSPFIPVTEHYGLHDLFFAIGLKLGIGIN